MQTIVFSLAALACPVGMGVMMWFMARGMRPQEKAPTVPPSLESMREEHLRLGIQLEQLEQEGAER